MIVPPLDPADADARHGALRSLRGELAPGDHELVRSLFEAEAAAHAAGTGDDDMLRLAGYLLSTFRDPEDVWLHHRAKMASYDTFASYPTASLAAAGLELTLAYVHGSSHPDRHDVLELLAMIGVDDVTEWRAWMNAEFPHVGG